MKNKILVTGSIAFDYLYRYDGKFQDALDMHAAHVSVAFDINDKKVHHGGCAANIVYTGAQLDDSFVMIGVVGKDFKEYAERLENMGISSEFVVWRNDLYTAQAAIVTDNSNQQLTFFYLGAARDSREHSDAMGKYIDELAASASLGIVAPNGKQFMEVALERFQRHSIPYLFDPGQATPIFSGEELLNYAGQSIGMIMNEYEAGLVQKQADIDYESLQKIAPFVVITLGERGARLFFEGKTYEIDGPKNPTVVDPTGCGDAFRAGMLATLNKAINNMNADLLLMACKTGTELAARCLAVEGTQNH